MKRILRVYRRTASIVKESSINMYENLVGKKKGFLLESYDKNYDRYTLFGAEPEEIITSRGNALVIQSRQGEEVRAGNPLERLKEYYSQFEIRKGADGLNFSGGLVGNLGYDFVRYSEELPDSNQDEIGIETIQMMLMTKFIVVDHVAETLTAVVLGEDSEEGERKALQEADALLIQADPGRGALRSQALAEGGQPIPEGQPAHGVHPVPEGQPAHGVYPVPEGQPAHGMQSVPEGQPAFVHDGKIIHKSDTLEGYSAKVEKIKSYIREGHIFQAVLSQRWTVETRQQGFALYRELRELNPSPYLYYFNFGDFEVIGSSPEMIVKQQGGRVYTCPIAGTRRRGRDAAEDQRLKEELLADEKERAEHVMLVDLARNDMGRISEFGTVKVTQFMEVQNYSHVMHIVSMVEGRRKGRCHPLDLAASFLPAGTLSGAPKIRAMEIIDELEESRRGLYGGATGYIDFSGDMDFCITIRTMVKKGERVYLQAGAGIVADSQPEMEYQECCNKVMALAQTLVGEEQL